MEDEIIAVVARGSSRNWSFAHNVALQMAVRARHKHSGSGSAVAVAEELLEKRLALGRTQNALQFFKRQGDNVIVM
jgi:hypothetical protein